MNTFAEDSLSDESLQRELQNKDDIILALTEQLEGTVDQLDRLKRSGVKENSGESRSTSPFGLASQVSDALEAYEELDPAEHFDRIENGISQILQLISNGSVQLSDSTSVPAETTQADVPEDDSFWEETKARLLGGNETASPTETSPPVSQPENSESIAEANLENEKSSDSETESVAVQVEIPSMPVAPKPVESLKDHVALEEGVGERDQYIVYLVARLRHAEQSKIPAIDWKELSNVPEDLVNELIELKTKLEDQLRQSEIAASLERASLTRERSKLFQVKQYLAQEVKRLSNVAQEAKPKSPELNNSESRWGKFFDTKKSSAKPKQNQ